MKKHAPATLRNREVIVDVLKEQLPAAGTVLEIASGSGEHVVYFAERFTDLVWQPSDPSPEALASIAEYRRDYDGTNVLAPVSLDVRKPDDWDGAAVEALLCVNMFQVSPRDTANALFAGAAQRLGAAAPLLLYGPYFEPGVEPASSNLAFDESLRQRNPEWGIPDLAAVDSSAEANGFTREKRYTMPSNNLMLAYRRV